jgi:hypothetical protein
MDVPRTTISVFLVLFGPKPQLTCSGSEATRHAVTALLFYSRSGETKKLLAASLQQPDQATNWLPIHPSFSPFTYSRPRTQDSGLKTQDLNYRLALGPPVIPISDGDPSGSERSGFPLLFRGESGARWKLSVSTNLGSTLRFPSRSV